MTVTVFGNGTVTGISAGGLPDGCVTPADLAVTGTTDGQVLTSTGAGSPPAFEAIPAAGGLTLGTEQATTSGASVTFSSIPAGTTVIHVNFKGVSLSGTNGLLVQIRDSGGIETSGYVSGGNMVKHATAISGYASTAGFVCNTGGGAAAGLWRGTAMLSLENSSTNSWCFSVVGYSDASTNQVGAGEKSLSGELTQLLLKGHASDTLDAGAVNISYM